MDGRKNASKIKAANVYLNILTHTDTERDTERENLKGYFKENLVMLFRIALISNAANKE